MLRRPLRYVALGDSYTIGTALKTVERWPDQLVARLAAASPGDPPLELARNLAVNGRTSADVIRDQLPRLWPLEPEFATVLIGVNDVVQGVTLDTYRRNVATLLDALLGRLGADRLLTVSTPAYTVTPQGAASGDAVLAEESAGRSIAHVDIHDLSLRASDDRSLVADDGLHPSGRQYALWVDRIAAVVMPLLGG